MVRNETSYETIKELNENKNYPIEILCKILGIPRSSYYKWKNRKKPRKEILDEKICQLILDYHKMFNGILGYRRMTLYINRFNHENYSEKYIHNLMKKLGVKSRIRRARPGYRKYKPEIEAENILNRDFNATKPNEKWLTDVTEFKILGDKRKLYLSAIFDLFDRSIVAYKINGSNNNQLVFDTFDLAMEKNPNAKPIFHSDRGYQYTSKVFKVKLTQAGMVQSMSRKGRCIDNGPMEAFWGTIKSEMFYLDKFNNLETLKDSIIKYIDFYNHYRLQANLKGLTPIEYRNQASLTI